MVVLDTTFLLDVMRADVPALDLLETLEGGSEPVRIPAAVVYELWEGLDRSRRPVREAQALAEVLDAYPQAPLTAAVARRAGRLSARLMREGTSLDDIDVVVAATALEEGEALVTRTEGDFGRIDDLMVRTY